MPNGECLIVRDAFDRAIRERRSNHTHFIDEETEALRGVTKLPKIVGVPVLDPKSFSL